MTTQFEAIRGRRLPTRYRSIITAEAKELPTMYALREKKAAQKKYDIQQERALSLAERSQKLQEKQAKTATYISTAQLGTQAYLGYKMGTPTAATVAPQVGTAGTSAQWARFAGAGSGGTQAGAGWARFGGGSGATTGQAGTGAGGGAGSMMGYLFAAYVGYKLWQGEKKRGAKYPGQPLAKSIGKSLGKGWKSFSRRF